MYVSEKDEAKFKLKEEETTDSPHLTASCQQPFRA